MKIGQALLKDRTQVPRKPGIYIFKNADGYVLYVGKAVDLYHRVASYFRGKPDSEKTASLVKNISSLETIIVESELEALILEANLIKKYLPPYNIRLTDDKDYLYIAITDEEYPKVVTARKKDLTGVKKYFGPFPSAATVRLTLKRLRRIFPWCASPPKETGISSRLRPCFYYHLKLCPGPCIGAVDKEGYKKIINNFSKFMEGQKGQLIQDLNQEMEAYVANLQYEEAQRMKKMIGGIEYLTQPNRIQRYLENPNFLEDERQQALEQLKADLHLAVLPERIEAYDISNISGDFATGSMVVLTGGDIDKSQYRKFKIHLSAGGSGRPNDYAMHQEMMGRRLKHKEWPQPDLILIDGGRGQVRAALAPVQEAGLNIPIFGLAKRMEWLYPPEGEILKLPKSSLSLKLLQKIRDESHRFAINFHRQLRARASGFQK